jgi:hypothetical protein
MSKTPGEQNQIMPAKVRHPCRSKERGFSQAGQAGRPTCILWTTWIRCPMFISHPITGTKSQRPPIMRSRREAADWMGKRQASSKLRGVPRLIWGSVFELLIGGLGWVEHGARLGLYSTRQVTGGNSRRITPLRSCLRFGNSRPRVAFFGKISCSMGYNEWVFIFYGWNHDREQESKQRRRQ